MHCQSFSRRFTGREQANSRREGGESVTHLSHLGRILTEWHNAYPAGYLLGDSIVHRGKTLSAGCTESARCTQRCGKLGESARIVAKGVCSLYNGRSIVLRLPRGLLLLALPHLL